MKNIKLDINKRTIIIIIVFSTIEVLMFLPIIIGFLIPSFAYFYWTHFVNYYYGIMFSAYQFLPFAQYYMLIFIFIILFILLVLIISVVNKNNSLEKKNKVLNKSIIYIEILFFFVFMTLFVSFSSNNNIRINSIDNKNSEKEYTLDDLIILDQFLSEKVFSMAPTFKRHNGNIVIDQKLEILAINDLHNLSSKYPFLRGIYPTKLRKFTKHMEKTESGTTGLTYPNSYTIFIDYRLNNIIVLNTITHELCHSKGVNRESEATLCSIEAGLNSDNVVSQYAAYLESFMRVNQSLYDINPKIADDHEEKLANMCLDNNYLEFCDINVKDINNYINKTDKIEFLSYRLRRYQNHPEFIDMLKTLKNAYDITLTIKNKKVSLEEVENQIEKGSIKRLFITMNNSNKSFEKIHSFLNLNQKYFWGIYQTNSKEKMPKKKTKKETIKYYLKPVSKENDIILILKDKYNDEYDYYRVTRLLLEYFDK